MKKEYLHCFAKSVNQNFHGQRRIVGGLASEKPNTENKTIQYLTLDRMKTEVKVADFVLRNEYYEYLLHFCQGRND